MNIWMAEDFRDTMVILLKRGTLIPILGAGISVGCHTRHGVVPGGTEYKQYMIKSLKSSGVFSSEEISEIEASRFSQICNYYEDDDNISEEKRVEYLIQNFRNVEYDNDDIRINIFDIAWPYIYTLNLDDAIEKNSSYNTKILPNRECREEIFNESRCVIKLHGDIDDIRTYKDGSKVFTTQEYAASLSSNSFLLNKLRNDYANQNILFIGCSLDDEMDLLTMSTSFPIKYTKVNRSSKTIIFVKGKPGKLQQSNFKNYGITDVVWFNDYREMYSFLSSTWKKASSVQDDDLGFYENIKMQNLSQFDGRNQEFFLLGRSLLDSESLTVMYPYFFITRDISKEIIKSITENKVHLVFGRRVSGKSYLLADIYRSIKDKQVYLFDGTSRVSDAALERLFASNAIVALFDIGTIDRNQFEKILLNAKRINSNHSNFIVNVNFNDSDTFGIVKWKLQEGKIENSDILRHTISNRWNCDESENKNELNTINERLPFLKIPIYNKKESFLDHIILSEKELGIKSQFAKKRIHVGTTKELVLLIMLAIREKIYSVEIISYSLETEIIEALREYEPFIERGDTHAFERSKADLSSTKYVLNAKLWLRRELGEYARKKENHKIIEDAFYYIISKIIDQNRNVFTQQKKCRNFILFDILNEVFLDQKGGQLSLLVHIYTRLHSRLAKDYNFLHQNAKCFIKYSTILQEKEEKTNYLEQATRLATVAKSIIEGAVEESHNEYLNITLAHIQYTRANALCHICTLENYTDSVHVSNAIEAVYIALSNPYNDKDYGKKDDDETVIKKFIREFKIYFPDDLDGEHINMMRELNAMTL